MNKWVTIFALIFLLLQGCSSNNIQTNSLIEKDETEQTPQVIIEETQDITIESDDTTEGSTSRSISTCSKKIDEITYSSTSDSKSYEEIEVTIDKPDTKPILANTFWTSFKRLLPGEGYFYYGCDNTPNNIINDPLDNCAAIKGRNSARPLTWIINIPSEGDYKIFLRRYYGIGGDEKILIDDTPLDTSKSERLYVNKNGLVYDWYYLGTVSLKRGDHWLDFTGIRAAVYDALLLTKDAEFKPNDTDIYDTELIKTPTTMAPRIYRAEKLIREKSGINQKDVRWFTASTDLFAEDVTDWVAFSKDNPAKIELDVLKNQNAVGAFHVVAGPKGIIAKITSSDLKSPIGDIISSSNISIKIARPEMMKSISWSKREKLKEYITDRPLSLLLTNDDTSSKPTEGKQGGINNKIALTKIGPFANRLIWIKAIPPKNTPSGTYTGKINIIDIDTPCIRSSIPISIHIREAKLDQISGVYGFNYPTIIGKTPPEYTEQFEKDVSFMSHLGMNTLTHLKDTIPEYMEILEKHNMTAPLRIQIPSTNYSEEDIIKMLKTAKGYNFRFPYLTFYQCEEPEYTDEDIEKIKKRIEYTKKLNDLIQPNYPDFKVESGGGFNNKEIYKLFIKDIENPTLNSLSIPKELVLEAKELGYKPRSYLCSGMTYPYVNRALIGIPNTVKGFVGYLPWVYTNPMTENPLDTKLNNYTDSNGNLIEICNSVYLDEYGNPISTRIAEALAEGIIDVRYLQTLERMIQEAEEKYAGGENVEAIDKIDKAQKSLDKVIKNSSYSNYALYFRNVKPTSFDEDRGLLFEQILILDKLMNN